MLSLTWLASVWDRVRTSYWFVPTLLSLTAAGASVGMQRLDYAYADTVPVGAWWIYGGNADGARTVLGAVAGSMITVASVVFSITIVTLTLASGQFGPRLLRTFIRDRGSQVVLGVFIAAFLYSVLVLRGVRGSGAGEFVPHLSVTLAVALAIASVGVLIYYIHHVAVAIQADQIVSAVAAEVDEAIERLFPEDIGTAADEVPRVGIARLPDEADAQVVRAARAGYVQAIDVERLLTTARKDDLLLKLAVRPGAFVAVSTPVAIAWPRERVSDAVADELRKSFVLGPHRTLTQDAPYGLQQLVEIGVRALSPGINDPFTAMSCLDRIGAALCRLTGRRFPSPYREDESHRLRVVAEASSFGLFVDVGFDQIRHNAASSPAVLIRLLETVNRVVECARTSEQKDALRPHARAIWDAGRREMKEERDRAALQECYQRSLRLLEGPAPRATLSASSR